MRERQKQRTAFSPGDYTAGHVDRSFSMAVIVNECGRAEQPQAVAAFERWGHGVKLLSLPDLTVTIAGNGRTSPQILHAGKPVRADILMHGSLLNADVTSTSVLRAFARQGSVVLNSAKAVETAGDKFATHVALTKLGIPRPDASLVSSHRQLVAASEAMGFPLVLKNRFGAEGNAVFPVRTSAELEMAAEIAWSRGPAALMLEQGKFAHPGVDYRVIVVGGRVSAYARRTTRQPGGLKSNDVPPFGADVKAVDLPPWVLAASARAVTSIGLDYGSCDWLKNDDGETDDFAVCEVNSDPWTKETGEACGRDVGEAIAAHAIDRVRAREITLGRQPFATLGACL